MSKHNFRELKVWKTGRLLVKEIYLVSQKFPEVEKYGLTNQIRRSAVSIPSNIAEGSAREGTKDFVRFLKISLGSVYELETQLLLAMDLNFVNEEELKSSMEMIIETQKMLNGLINKLSKETSLLSFVLTL